ncbi:hypothetical protein [Hydrogenophaga sp. PBL-H3]|uniref:hypothetical protein n=1 Tax=Hydrogenophaga sp. PBL-H3 TaxID=434010 RepID=UPI00132027DF|nr:hypothetical protein [Hydrogenophaga sp. PBL-H3]QHE75084.1 hypothetical protein F9Z45_02955 [Hydrogenophaga sp. PBL-H3]QHE79511.1 hypothetical protein F9Z44_02955 [Hydrogenophaga sp. PBL-H3]
MQATAATLPDAPSLQVLLVCPRGEHLQRVRSLTSGWPQAAHVHWTSDPEDAMRWALACPPHLVIVDARLDRACDLALSERLRRGRPDLVVMNFDEPCRQESQARCSHWHWSELPRATGWWVQRHFDAQAHAAQRSPVLQ